MLTIISRRRLTCPQALDQPDEKRDYLKEKVITEAGEAVADEDRGRLQTLQEVIGFVFVAVEGALTNLRADLDASAYEATATGQLLQDIDAVRLSVASHHSTDAHSSSP